MDSEHTEEIKQEIQQEIKQGIEEGIKEEIKQEIEEASAVESEEQTLEEKETLEVFKRLVELSQDKDAMETLIKITDRFMEVTDRSDGATGGQSSGRGRRVRRKRKELRYRMVD